MTLQTKIVNSIFSPFDVGDICPPDSQHNLIPLPEFENAEQDRIGKITFLNSFLSTSGSKQPDIYRNSISLKLGNERRNVYFRKFSRRNLTKANQIIDKIKLKKLLHNSIYPVCIYAQSLGDKSTVEQQVDHLLSQIDPYKLFFSFINTQEQYPQGEYSFPLSGYGLTQTIKNNLSLLFDRKIIESILKKISKEQNFTRREILFLLSIFKPEQMVTDAYAEA